MAIARKPTVKSVKPVEIEGSAETVAVSAPLDAEQIIPGLEETLDATLSKAEEIQEQVRQNAEQSVEQTKRMFEKLKTAAEEATSSVETSFSTISKGMNEINMKALEAIKANTEAQFAFVKALLETKSISEAITLQGEHARSQFEALNAQAKELAALIQQVSADSVEPIKASLSKGFQIAA